MTVLTVAGGVALILFGVRFLRKGLDRLFGPRLGAWMQRLASGRLRAMFTGLGIALVTPSSTTVSLLACSTVQAGHLSARQMFAVMLGADIGLTAMVLLISLRIEHYAPVLTLIGVLLFQFSQRDRPRGIGQVVLSLSFILMGIATIRAAIAAANGSPESDLSKLMAIIEHYPLALATAAALMAFVMQSSTATIALVLGVGAANHVTLPVAVASVVGANVGTALTMLAVGWKQLESRRLAMANLVSKFALAMAVLYLLAPVASLLSLIPGTINNRVAYAHTGFNLVLAAIALPLVGPITALVAKLLPEPPPTDVQPFGPRHINLDHVESNAVALNQSMKEILHVGEIIREMISSLWEAMNRHDEAAAHAVQELDDRVDLLDAQIKRYLTRSLSFDADTRDSAEQMRQLRYLNELETIGDIIDKNLSELVIKKIKLGVDFSREGREELDDFYRKVCENLLIAETAFTTRDAILAQRLLTHKQYIRDYERTLRDRHFTRLKAGLAESHETSAIHLDLLTYLKRINSHVSHVGYAILDGSMAK
jgi:phosphate:Na+ symporter